MTILPKNAGVDELARATQTGGMPSPTEPQDRNTRDAAPMSTPARIVESDGRVHTGWFDRPFVDASLDAAPVVHPLSRLRGTPFAPIERAFSALRLKQWHYTSVVTDKLLFACAVVDAGYLGNAFAYVVCRQTGETYEYSTLTPGAAGITIAANSIDGTTSIRWPGFGTLALHNDSARGERRIVANLVGRKHFGARPPLVADILIRDNGRKPEPIIVVEESAPGRWIYTHKCYALEASGTLRAGTLGDAFAVGEGLAGIDYNRGHRMRETYWNWAAASGHATEGTRIGWNLTTGRRPDEPPSSSGDEAGESALWLGDACVKLGSVHFEYDNRELMKPWRIRDLEGLVDLTFAPVGERAEDINAGILVSRFHQPYGRFSGTLRRRDGATFTLDNVYGVVEQHFAKW